MSEWKWESLGCPIQKLRKKMHKEILTSDFAIIVLAEDGETPLIFRFEVSDETAVNHRRRVLCAPERFDTAHWLPDDFERNDFIFVMYGAETTSLGMIKPTNAMRGEARIGWTDEPLVAMYRMYTPGGSYYILGHELFENFLIQLLDFIEE